MVGSPNEGERGVKRKVVIDQGAGNERKRNAREMCADVEGAMEDDVRASSRAIAVGRDAPRGLARPATRARLDQGLHGHVLFGLRAGSTGSSGPEFMIRTSCLRTSTMPSHLLHARYV